MVDCFNFLDFYFLVCSFFFYMSVFAMCFCDFFCSDYFFFVFILWYLCLKMLYEETQRLSAYTNHCCSIQHSVCSWTYRPPTGVLHMICYKELYVPAVRRREFADMMHSNTGEYKCDIAVKVRCFQCNVFKNGFLRVNFVFWLWKIVYLINFLFTKNCVFDQFFLCKKLCIWSVFVCEKLCIWAAIIFHWYFYILILCK